MNTSKKESVLHIDDDEANRYAVRMILERAGYEIHDAETGREGIAIAEKVLPDLIILDIRLPDIDGYEVTRVLKSRPHLSSIPILQTSATFVSSEDKVEGLESGADGYLAQPIDNAVLVATVKSLLRIRTAEREAQSARQMQEEIMAIVSHDLRNPLSVVMLQAKLLEKEMQKEIKPDSVAQKIEKITASCNRMNKLIEDLLTVTNIEQGNLKLMKSPISVNGLVHDVYLSFEDLAAQKQVRLKKQIDYKKEPVITADRDRIFQALANIVSNALRFTPPEGSIEVGVEETDASYLFHVKDSGAGIPASNLPHIFDRYWQGHKDRSTGVGLGLSIVKGIIDAHNGSVWVESEIGKGANFFFILPK